MHSNVAMCKQKQRENHTEGGAAGETAHHQLTQHHQMSAPAAATPTSTKEMRGELQKKNRTIVLALSSIAAATSFPSPL
jgi:hypothetical protein